MRKGVVFVVVLLWLSIAMTLVGAGAHFAKHHWPDAGARLLMACVLVFAMEVYRRG